MRTGILALGLAAGLGLLGRPAAAIPLVLDFANGPVVFDFEDGEQGWEFTGSAERVETQIFGPDWAVFGDGLFLTEFEVLPGIVIGSFDTALSAEVDLTDVARIEVDQWFPSGVGMLVGGHVVELTSAILVSVLFDAVEPAQNPGTKVFDVSGIDGTVDLFFWWGFPGNPELLEPTAAVGFIDNITFFPIPEPATATLLAIGLALLAVRRSPRRHE
jgi:hypothetical protein